MGVVNGRSVPTGEAGAGKAKEGRSMKEVSIEAGAASGGEAAFPVGSWERPDAAGVVLRGDAAGEAPLCWVGRPEGEFACEQRATMQVYGLAMCPEHGEEVASGALEEIAYDLEQELQRPMNDHVRGLSPHIRAALSYGFGSLPDGWQDHERSDEAALKAFPLDRGRVCHETLSYAQDPDDLLPPCDTYMLARLLVCRLMRLAFEEEATWLVEVLESERESVAAQLAYALALESEAELR